MYGCSFKVQLVTEYFRAKISAFQTPREPTRTSEHIQTKLKVSCEEPVDRETWKHLRRAETPSEVAMPPCSVNYLSPLVFHTCRGTSAQTQQPAASSRAGAWLISGYFTLSLHLKAWLRNELLLLLPPPPSSPTRVALILLHWSFLARLECWEERCETVWICMIQRTHQTHTHTHAAGDTLTVLMIPPLNPTPFTKRKCKQGRPFKRS